MANNDLSPESKYILQSMMSINETATVLRNLTRNFAQNDWLGPGNQFRISSLAQLRGLGKHVKKLTGPDLPEYITASALLHCLDGWSYLSRSLDGHIAGNADAARHMAYYAELRGAMAILAVHGVGIFETRHFVVEGSNVARKIPDHMRTHPMTQKVYECWAQSDRAAELLFSIIQAFGIQLGEWLRGLYTVLDYSGREISFEWWRTFGLDLEHMAYDHYARNESAYRPTFFHNTGSLGTDDSLRFLLDFWRSLEPSGGTTFEEVDKFLVRRSLERAFERLTDETPKAQPHEYERKVSQLLDQVVAQDDSSLQRIKDFFLRRSFADDPAILHRALASSAITEPGQHLEVISRATLLLRVASGACAQLFRQADVSVHQVRFWWEQLGIERGLWDPSTPPALLADLWADIEAAIDDVENAAQPGTPLSTHFIKHEYAKPLVMLKECELIGLWSLGL